MIKMSKVTKIYNQDKSNQVNALKSVSLNINKGEMVSIMGRSGAGKSTILHIIACIEKIDDGELFINNTNVSSLHDKELSKIRNEQIGIIMQDFSLIDTETALYNVMMPLYFSKHQIKNFKKMALDILDKLNILDLASRKISEMSGGQKQRVAIARALINNPNILLADEPTGALDIKTSKEIMDLIKKLNQIGKTVVVVTHDKTVSNFCDRNIVIEDGEIIQT